MTGPERGRGALVPMALAALCAVCMSAASVEAQANRQPLKVTAVGMKSSLGTQNAYQGHCPVRVVFTATIRKTGGPGIVRYVWARSSGEKVGQQVQFGPGNLQRQVQHIWPVAGHNVERDLWVQLQVAVPEGSPGVQAHFRVKCS